MQRVPLKWTSFWPRFSLSVVLGMIFAGPVSSSAVQIDDVGVLRDLLDSDFDTAIEHLAGWNRTLIQDLEVSAPEEAIALEARLERPETLPSTNNLPLAESNFGRGLVTFLFDEDLSVEQVNLLFCDERVGSIQVLFDDVETFGDTEQLLSRVHGMGPAVPFGSHAPAFRYPLPGVTYNEFGEWSLKVGASPITVWNLGTLEELYQPVAAQRVITSQVLFDEQGTGLTVRQGITKWGQSPIPRFSKSA
jgi:hypothetical protein